MKASSEVQDYDVNNLYIFSDELEKNNEQANDTKDAVSEPDTKRQQTNEQSKEFLEEGRIYFFYRFRFLSCFFLWAGSVSSIWRDCCQPSPFPIEIEAGPKMPVLPDTPGNRSLCQLCM